MASNSAGTESSLRVHAADLERGMHQLVVGTRPAGSPPAYGENISSIRVARGPAVEVIEAPDCTKCSCRYCANVDRMVLEMSNLFEEDVVPLVNMSGRLTDLLHFTTEEVELPSLVHLVYFILLVIVIIFVLFSINSSSAQSDIDKLNGRLDALQAKINQS